MHTDINKVFPIYYRVAKCILVTFIRIILLSLNYCMTRGLQIKCACSTKINIVTLNALDKTITRADLLKVRYWVLAFVCIHRCQFMVKPFMFTFGRESPFFFTASASAIFSVSVVSSSAFPSFALLFWVENSLNIQGKNSTMLTIPVRALTYLEKNGV